MESIRRRERKRSLTGSQVSVKCILKCDKANLKHGNISDSLDNPGHHLHLLGLLGGVTVVLLVRGQVVDCAHIPAAAQVIEVGADLREHNHHIVTGGQRQEACLQGIARPYPLPKDVIKTFLSKEENKNVSKEVSSHLVWAHPCRCR